MRLGNEMDLMFLGNFLSLTIIFLFCFVFYLMSKSVKYQCWNSDRCGSENVIFSKEVSSCDNLLVIRPNESAFKKTFYTLLVDNGAGAYYEEKSGDDESIQSCYCFADDYRKCKCHGEGEKDQRYSDESDESGSSVGGGGAYGDPSTAAGMGDGISGISAEKDDQKQSEDEQKRLTDEEKRLTDEEKSKQVHTIYDPYLLQKEESLEIIKRSYDVQDDTVQLPHDVTQIGEEIESFYDIEKHESYEKSGIKKEFKKSHGIEKEDTVQKPDDKIQTEKGKLLEITESKIRDEIDESNKQTKQIPYNKVKFEKNELIKTEAVAKQEPYEETKIMKEFGEFSKIAEDTEQKRYDKIQSEENELLKIKAAGIQKPYEEIKIIEEFGEFSKTTKDPKQKRYDEIESELNKLFESEAASIQKPYEEIKIIEELGEFSKITKDTKQKVNDKIQSEENELFKSEADVIEKPYEEIKILEEFEEFSKIAEDTERKRYDKVQTEEDKLLEMKKVELPKSYDETKIKEIIENFSKIELDKEQKPFDENKLLGTEEEIKIIKEIERHYEIEEEEKGGEEKDFIPKPKDEIQVEQELKEVLESVKKGFIEPDDKIIQITEKLIDDHETNIHIPTLIKETPTRERAIDGKDDELLEEEIGIISLETEPETKIIYKSNAKDEVLVPITEIIEEKEDIVPEIVVKKTPLSTLKQTDELQTLPTLSPYKPEISRKMLAKQDIGFKPSPLIFKPDADDIIETKSSPTIHLSTQDESEKLPLPSVTEISKIITDSDKSPSTIVKQLTGKDGSPEHPSEFDDPKLAESDKLFYTAKSSFTSEIEPFTYYTSQPSSTSEEFKTEKTCVCRKSCQADLEDKDDTALLDTGTEDYNIQFYVPAVLEKSWKTDEDFCSTVQKKVCGCRSGVACSIHPKNYSKLYNPQEKIKKLADQANTYLDMAKRTCDNIKKRDPNVLTYLQQKDTLFCVADCACPSCQDSLYTNTDDYDDDYNNKDDDDYNNKETRNNNAQTENDYDSEPSEASLCSKRSSKCVGPGGGILKWNVEKPSDATVACTEKCNKIRISSPTTAHSIKITGRKSGSSFQGAKVEWEVEKDSKTQVTYDNNKINIKTDPNNKQAKIKLKAHLVKNQGNELSQSANEKSLDTSLRPQINIPNEKTANTTLSQCSCPEESCNETTAQNINLNSNVNSTCSQSNDKKCLSTIQKETSDTSLVCVCVPSDKGAMIWKDKHNKVLCTDDCKKVDIFATGKGKVRVDLGSPNSDAQIFIKSTKEMTKSLPNSRPLSPHTVKQSSVKLTFNKETRNIIIQTSPSKEVIANSYSDIQVYDAFAPYSENSYPVDSDYPSSSTFSSKY